MSRSRKALFVPRFAGLALALLLLSGAPAPRSGGAASGAKGTARATFAGGCFWCMEPPFESLPGVLSVTSGFSGGPERNPTYKEVSSGRTGHAEAVEIVYDPGRISYARLLDAFWHNIDPTQSDGQFCDHGAQYRSAIFYRDASQRSLARESKRSIERSAKLKRPIVTQIMPFKAFYPAEEYHQDYYRKNPDHYRAYRAGCGRDRRLREIWGSAAAKH